jgi:hypothetical protein
MMDDNSSVFEHVHLAIPLYKIAFHTKEDNVIRCLDQYCNTVTKHNSIFHLFISLN